MKHLFTLMAALALTAGVTATAQSTDRTKTLPTVKASGNVNPINPFQMCADPTAVEYEGRLYVYGSNDQQEYDGNGGEGNNTYGRIRSLVMMSTQDMVNWTFHGTIPMDQVCGGWMACSWAPSIVSRVEDDGLTHFYMYFANSGGGVGLVTSTSPVGPWTDPLKRAFLNGSTPGVAPCTCPFDPGVVIDDNGVGWLSFGGLDPVPGGSSLYPGNSKIVRLSKDMLGFDSEVVTIPAPYHFEANELNYINGKYVYTYCSNWAQRDIWQSEGFSGSAPSICSMCYMTADNPLDANDWKYGGDILKNPGQFGYPTGNNHSHMHKFAGKWYMFYHTQVMENLQGIKGAYRSIAVDEVDVDEENVKINVIKMTDKGPGMIAENRINALERQEAETMCNGAGFKITNSSTAGNTYLTDVQHGAFTLVKKVDFGEQGANHLRVHMRGNGRLEVRVDRTGVDPIAVVDYANNRYTEYEVPMEKTLTGEHNLYFIFSNPDSKTRYDWWQFYYDSTTELLKVGGANEPVSVEYYNIDGVKVTPDHQGFTIRRSTYPDGSVKTVKVMN